MTAYRIRGDVVREAAKAKGHNTIRSIAAATGIHPITLGDLLKGQRTTGLHSAMRLSTEYGPTVNEIVEAVEEADDDTDVALAA